MIVLIDNYDSFTYNLYQLCAAIYPEIEVVRNDRISLQELQKKNPAGIILSPGPGIPQEAGICIPIVNAFYRHVPILGVCLGHQAIGAAFGGEICRAQEIMHGKSSPVFHCRKDLFKDVDLPFEAGRYHSLVVKRESLPPKLEIQAETLDGVIMAMRHRNAPTFGIQFHPESILTSEGEKILSHFIQLCQSRPIYVDACT